MLGAIKRLLPWLLTTALSIAMILLSRDQEMAPLQGQVNDLVAMGGYPISAGVRIFAIWSTNRLLRSQLAAQTLERSEYEEVLRENERLRRMLDYKSRSPLNLIAAEVVGFSSDEGVKGLLINRGSYDGITTNQAVISPEGLVGRVFRVSDNSAAVQLLGDPNLGVAARIIKAQESGIVHAAGTGRLKLDGVPVSATANIGDSVVTTGQGGIFPPGILIGFTTKIYPSMEGWLLTVELKPGVDLRRVEEVFVIRSLTASE
jgi:rod shape-determining protein MreC